MCTVGAQRILEEANQTPEDVRELLSLTPFEIVRVSHVIEYMERAHASRAKGRQPDVPLRLKQGVTIRDYQVDAAERVRGKSGFITAPCASGKTLIGCLVGANAGGRTFILTPRYPDQWVETIGRFFSTSASVIQLTGDIQLPDTRNLAVVACTYSFFMTGRTEALRYIKQLDYTALIIDEAHAVAANGILGQIRQLRYEHCVLLTATKVREDNGLETLERVFGPTIVEIPRKLLVDRGYVSEVCIRNVVIPYPDALRSKPLQEIFRTIHPEKLRVLQCVLQRGIERLHRTLIFCDCLFCIDWLFNHLKAVFDVPLLGPVTLATRPQTRSRVYDDFVNLPGPTVLLVSRTGDEAIDIPDASQAIVMWNGWASRRQHLQRIGRISRPSEKECEFWVLMSNDAREQESVDHRDAYIRTHGFTVNTHGYRQIGFRVERPTTDELEAYAETVIGTHAKFNRQEECATRSARVTKKSRLRMLRGNARQTSRGQPKPPPQRLPHR